MGLDPRFKRPIVNQAKVSLTHKVGIFLLSKGPTGYYYGKSACLKCSDTCSHAHVFSFFLSFLSQSVALNKKDFNKNKRGCTCHDTILNSQPLRTCEFLQSLSCCLSSPATIAAIVPESPFVGTLLRIQTGFLGTEHSVKDPSCCYCRRGGTRTFLPTSKGIAGQVSEICSFAFSSRLAQVF